MAEPISNTRVDTRRGRQSVPQGRRRFAIDDLLSEIGRHGRVSRRTALLAWGLTGFLIGSVLWHVIGVWGLLGAAVLKGREASGSVVAWQQPPPPATLPNCTVLHLHRATGRTISGPCPEDLTAFEEAQLGRRDLALVEAR